MASSYAFYNLIELRSNVPDASIARSLLLKLQASIADEIAALEVAQRQNDRVELTTLAHRLASVSLYLGVDGIGKPAEGLKNALESEDFEGPTDALVVSLIDACRQFKRQSADELRALVS